MIQIKKFTFGLDWVPKKLGKEDEKDRTYRYWESYMGMVVITAKRKVTTPKGAADYSILHPQGLTLPRYPKRILCFCPYGEAEQDCILQMSPLKCQRSWISLHCREQGCKMEKKKCQTSHPHW